MGISVDILFDLGNVSSTTLIDELISRDSQDDLKRLDELAFRYLEKRLNPNQNLALKELRLKQKKEAVQDTNNN